MVSVISFIGLLLIGILSAIIGSIVGLGGGIIIVPSLILLSPAMFGEALSSATAVGTSLAVLIFTALTSTLTFIRQKRVDFRSGWLLFITSGPGALLGAALTGKLQGGVFELTFGLFMLGMACLLLIRDRLKPLPIEWKIQRTYTDAEGKTVSYGYNILPMLLIGLLVGFVSGLFGIGGGSLFVPVMVLLFRYPPHVATATSMLVIFLSSILGSVSHFYQGHIDGWAFLALAPGAIVGGWLGARIAGRLSSRKLMLALRLTLFALAAYMIGSGLS